MTDQQLDLLTAIADNPTPLAEDYRRRIRAAMSDDATTHGGIVNPNRVRAALSGPHGLTVDPRMLSATYGALRAKGVLVFWRWVDNDDVHGRNAGKQQRTWRLVGEL